VTDHAVGALLVGGTRQARAVAGTHADAYDAARQEGSDTGVEVESTVGAYPDRPPAAGPDGRVGTTLCGDAR
jgi:hypothetical protein